MVTTDYRTTSGMQVTAVWQEGTLAPVELHIKADAGISTRALKAIRFAALAPKPEAIPGVTMTLDEAGEWLDEHSASAGHRTNLSPRFLAMVSVAYSLAIMEGYSDAAACVADLSGVRVPTTEQWIRKARQEGFLSSTTHGHNGGRSHGTPTAKALEAIK